MLADGKARAKLLPDMYKDYAPTSIVKGLHPEVKKENTGQGAAHTTDFVLYPMPAEAKKKNLRPLNIEIKWNVEDFEAQPERFPYYNGTEAIGYVVAIRPEDPNKEKRFADGHSQIPVVYLDADPFKQWFIRNSYLIISQAFSNKFGARPNRLTGP